MYEIISIAEPINTFNCSRETENEPIRITYHRNVHYNSLVDPYKATIGVGLGLPGFQPGVYITCHLMFNSRTKNNNKLTCYKFNVMACKQ